MQEAAIRVHKLSRDFRHVRALDSLGFDVPRGGCFGFLGLNGAGKTTTIRILLGLLEPTEGHAEVLGLDTKESGEEIRERCGALLEHHGLYERLNAEDNLEFYARAFRVPPSLKRDRIRELLDDMGLWERRRERVGTWSRGMKQKLAVARALLHRPDLVFLDEPTAGLDPVAAMQFREDLSALAEREGLTVFLTTHNLQEAEQMCSRVAILRHGRIVASGRPDRLRFERHVFQVDIKGYGFETGILDALRARAGITDVRRSRSGVTLQLEPAVQIPSVIGFLVQCGVSIHAVQRDDDSLENAFLRLMEIDHAS